MMLLQGWLDAGYRAPPEPGWPAMGAVLGHERAGRWDERLKYQLRLAASRCERSMFAEALQSMEPWHRMFQREPTLHYVPFRLFLDRRWRAQERFMACERDLVCALAKFGPGLSHHIAQGHALRLCEHGGFAVDLMRNTVSCHEGLWALRLCTPEGLPLFNLSFAFLNAHTVLIGSVQGLQKGGAEGGQEAIRAFTKAAHGLRPHAFLMASLQAACQAWGVARVRGIDPLHQVKRRRDADKQGFRFDYREFWRSQGGSREALGASHWHLPTTPVRRDDGDIATHKRAAYRRRYALLDALPAPVAARLREAGAPAAAAP